MELYKDEPFLIYQDKDFFTEAVHFTARRRGISAILVEKDYYCSVLLAYFYNDKNTPLVFKGGTSLSKIYADFYRMSEDLDFLISVPPDVSRSKRKKQVAPIKDLFSKIPDKIYGLDILEDLKGFNNSKQYIGYVSYKSKVAISDEPQKIKIEIGLREQTVYSPVWKDAGTLLIDPFNSSYFILNPGLILSIGISDNFIPDLITNNFLSPFLTSKEAACRTAVSNITQFSVELTVFSITQTPLS